MATRAKRTAIASTGGVRRLAANSTMRIGRGRPVTIRVERGTVLVTQEGDLEDHVLEQGDEIVLARGGLAIAWAFTDAAISMREGAASPRPPAPWRGRDDDSPRAA